MSNTEFSPGRLMIIARNAHGQIVTRIASRYELAGALRTAYSVLRLKDEAVGVEIHANEGAMSAYSGKPLVMISTDDLVLIRRDLS